MIFRSPIARAAFIVLLILIIATILTSCVTTGVTQPTYTYAVHSATGATYIEQCTNVYTNRVEPIVDGWTYTCEDE
jgi:hypothetical protein